MTVFHLKNPFIRECFAFSIESNFKIVHKLKQQFEGGSKTNTIIEINNAL